MSQIPLEFVANNLQFSDRRHPVDFLEPFEDENRLAGDALVRVLAWITQGRSLEKRGYRAMVAFRCIRPGSLDEGTLQEVGDTIGHSRQAVHQLLVDFKETFAYGYGK